MIALKVAEVDKQCSDSLPEDFVEFMDDLRPKLKEFIVLLQHHEDFDNMERCIQISLCQNGQQQGMGILEIFGHSNYNGSKITETFQENY